MGYPKDLLGNGETIEFEMKPHWRALVVPLLWLLGVLAVAVFLIAKIDNSVVRWVIVASRQEVIRVLRSGGTIRPRGSVSTPASTAGSA